MASTYPSGQALPAMGARERNVPRSSHPMRRSPQFQRADPVALSTLIECEVIPRLMGARHRSGGQAVPVEMPVISPAEVEAFTPLTLQVEADELLALVETMLARGVTAEALLLDLLAPAARTLGEYWKDDRCDFVDVTMGLWRLQEVVHELAARVPFAEGRANDVRRALFAVVPGDQHSFGPLVIEQVFSRAGWDTDRLGESTAALLCERLSGGWFDIAGLTGGSECHIGALPSVILAMRSVSRNPHLRVLVGGPAFLENPALVDDVGADGTAPDARAALALADAMVQAVAFQTGG
ncbi:cobalamin B12-binding domain-containing protein [Sphingomonas qomolangmaensis]|uniref:Cobalamin B12-binding domain-containing protein n=1 Tax=Sphingomonas qomolangmaensis TaxID=2918765 RepID=A0ABY5LAL1_9SPHN|nr:B12-binding domain-containing protein [Sphingomonas qomolangmaensis]UUL83078.1 cobalamin B12-binding domain-containing protein [Sphingomonas qomolangmaensis]